MQTMLHGSSNSMTSGGRASLKIGYYPSSFRPGENDVLIGKGKNWHMHGGNRRLRKLVTLRLDEYLAATKSEKSYILSEILSQLRIHDDPKSSKKKARFVKFDNSVGSWMEVSDVQAKEKVSQAFRDALHEYYRSSSRSKCKRKRERENAAPNNTNHRTSGKHPRIEPMEFGMDNDELLQIMSSIFHLNKDSSSCLSLSLASTSTGTSLCKGNCEDDTTAPNNMTGSTLGKHPRIEPLHFGIDNDELLQILSSIFHLNEDSRNGSSPNMASTSSSTTKCNRKCEQENIVPNNMAGTTLGKHHRIEPMQFGMDNHELLQILSSSFHLNETSSNWLPLSME